VSAPQVTVYPYTLRSLPALARLLKAGGVVVAPSETAYGLFADSTNAQAVARVARLKGRKGAKPLPLIAAHVRMVGRYCRMNAQEKKLTSRFWPGPLTLALRTKKEFPRGVAAANGTVGIRVPGSAWLRKLALGVGRPLVATSANVAGAPTPYSVSQVRQALVKRGLLHMVDGGALRKRPTSTVAQVRRGRVVVFREGAITRVRLERMLRS
jgi:L-threonylcarbamoyladenylate synthase